MKKAYVKPEIMFEDFTLSKSIAAGCEALITTSTMGTCGIKYGTLTLFVEPYAVCSTKPVPGSAYDKMCYDVPTEDNNLFNS